METIQQCPACGEKKFKAFLEGEDRLVSKKYFKIVTCESCGFHFTNPIPSLQELPSFYASEDYISHTAKKKGLINGLYFLARKYTLLQKTRWIKKENKGTKLLDIGSGTGHFLKTINKHGFSGVGIEPDEGAREYAHKHNHVRSSPQEDLYKIEEGSFDIITMWHVLEHVYNLREDISQIHKILKNDGHLFIAVPNMNSLDARHYKEKWDAYDLPRHLYHFKEADITRLLLDLGFNLKKIIPMRLDAYYASMLSQKHCNRFFLWGLFIGWWSNRSGKKYGYSSQVYVFEKK